MTAARRSCTGHCRRACRLARGRRSRACVLAGSPGWHRERRSERRARRGPRWAAPSWERASMSRSATWPDWLLAWRWRTERHIHPGRPSRGSRTRRAAPAPGSAVRVFSSVGSLLSHRMVSIADKNLSRERDIPVRLEYIGPAVERDWVDNLVERWSGLQPGLPVDAYHVTGRISRIAARLAQRQDEIFARYGLNRGDVGVLSALVMARPPHTLSPTQLFRGLMLSSAGMTKRLDRLESRGLVKRRPDPKDRRGVTIQLSESGRRLVAKAVAENTKTEAEILKGLSPKERRFLADSLRALLHELEPATGG